MSGIGIFDIQQINLMLTILQVILFTITSIYLLYKSYKIKDRNIALIAIYISFFAILSSVSVVILICVFTTFQKKKQICKVFQRIILIFSGLH